MKTELAAVCLLILCVGDASPAGLQLQGSLIKVSETIGSDVGSGADAREPAAAYNSLDDKYLTVWRADTRINNQAEVFGQLLDRTGSKVGGEIQIATFGSTGDDANDPDVVYNPSQNEFLVVWNRTITTATNEIYGQRIAADGSSVGSSVQISNLVAGTSAGDPSVALNSSVNEYLVTWTSNEGASSGEGSQQVWGQRLDNTASDLGGDFQISNLGNGSSVANPDVTYNGSTNQYTVVWSGDRTIPSSTNKEVFGQLLEDDGSETSTEFQITTATGINEDATRPHVAYNSIDDEYLVTFTFTAADEIHGQRLDGSGGEIGTSDFQISDRAAVGSLGFAYSDLTYNPDGNEYLTVFRERTGDINVFGQVVDSDGTQLGSQLQISDVLSDRDVGDTPRVVYNSDDNEYLTVWRADGPPSEATDGVDEIFAQRLVPEPATLILLGVGGFILPGLIGRRRRR